jgi:hypothetical protein
MTNRSFLTQVALSALLIAGVASEASAASQRTFVASFGSDASPTCSIGSPCRGFAAAMAQTLTNGEVIVLDSAGYGTVTISQQVSIIAPPGVYAGITVGGGGTGITVNAPGSKVTLRGLTINALGGTTGVAVTAAAVVYLDRMTINAFSTGLSVAASAATTINISQSAFRDNTTGAAFSTTSGIATVSIEGSVFERNAGSGVAFANNTVGAIVGSLFAGGGIGVNANATAGAAKVEIRDSNVNDHTSFGLAAGPSVSGAATISVVSSVVSGNGVGLSANGATNEIYSSDSTITRNGTGLQSASSGVLRTGQDNRLVNNTANGAFTTSTGKL